MSPTSIYLTCIGTTENYLANTQSITEQDKELEMIHSHTELGLLDVEASIF